MTVQREQLEADVLIVGAGPAGLACALHLANLIKKHNAAGGKPELSAENIYVLEKGREIGAHQLSGAIMNPKALAELVPDFEKSAPLDTPVTDDAALLFTRGSSFRFPITPPPFKNMGNYVVSLSKVTKWLGGLVEAAGVNLFKEFGGAEVVYEGEGIGGVITEDKGVDKNGKPKDNYTPGYELRAKVTVLAEGTRGSLTKKLVEKKKLDNINPQSYGIGIKELWDVQPGRIAPGYVAHTLGWPVSTDMYGGGWIYGLANNRVSIGLVLALEYANPQFDPHEAFQNSGFAAAEGHSSGDEERDAGGGNDFRSAEGRRYIVENAQRLPEKNRAKLHQERAVAGAEFSPVLPARNVSWIFSYGVPANQRRARIDRSDAGARGV